MLFSRMEYITILFVIAMMAVAEYFQINAIIFPEIAALAFGAWVMEDRPWDGPAWTIWFSPTLGAVTGILVLHYIPYQLVVLICIAFLLVFLELKVVRSSMSPSFSAAILPIITHVTSWIYPLSVCLMTAVIAAVASRNEKTVPAAGGLSAAVKCRRPRNAWAEALHCGKLLFFVLLLALLSVKSRWIYILSPPLVVAFVELTHPGSTLRQKSMKGLLLLLVSSALAGMFWVHVVVHVLSAPLWFAAGLAVATTFLLARLLRIASPPAFALALLPTILPQQVLYAYPLHVLIGSLLFIAISLIWFRTAKTP